MLTQAPRGTKDVLPAESYRWQALEARMRSAAALAGYREVRTPVFEHTELFLRGVGDTTDIVQKEMYTFQDKGDRSITLKPEGTAGAVRCFLEHNLYADALPCKMYYLNAPIFRYENPQSGRLREHHQFGVECFGAKEATADAELILLAYHLLQDLGVKNLSVEINSIGCPKCRPVYHSRLKEFLGERIDQMCATCRERFDRNPLRVLDCKEKKCQELTKDAPNMLDLLCDECRGHFGQLQECLSLAGIPYRINSRIVRGLDYYTKTVFELITETKDGKLTVCGGGRYDNLVAQIGDQDIPAVGFGMGLERVLMLLDGTVLTVAHNTVLAFDKGDELGVEEFLVGPAIHVEVAVPDVLRVGAACVRHDDNHGADFTRAHQFVGNLVDAALLHPCGVSVGEAVQQVEHGVLGIGVLLKAEG